MSLWFCGEHGLTGPVPCCGGASLARIGDPGTFTCTYCKCTIGFNPTELAFHGGNPLPGAVTPRCMEGFANDAKVV